MSTVEPVADVFETGEWPFGPRTHDVGWRFLFDMAMVGGMLGCRPGDRILDLGAGSGFSTEMLVRFGYRVIALDPDAPALRRGMRRLRLDRRLRPEVAWAAAGIAERLPFADRSFDGVVGMNVIHHVDDLGAAVEELARVLKPGGRAAFSEPGRRHLDFPETARAIREHGENDKAFDVRELATIARTRGFRRIELRPSAYPFMNPIEERELEDFIRGRHPVSCNRPEGLVEYMIESHPLFVMVREGTRPIDSRAPGRLAATIEIGPFDPTTRPGDILTVEVRSRNDGDTLWLAGPFEFGGYVTFGCKLARPDGRVITDLLGRTRIDRDVSPGQWVAGTIALEIPPDLPAGEYRLTFDMIDEWVCWFGDSSMEGLPSYPVTIEDARA